MLTTQLQHEIPEFFGAEMDGTLLTCLFKGLAQSN
jgi:hypothetical protein